MATVEAVRARPRAYALGAARLAVVPAAIVLCAQYALLRPAFIDDSFIFYRYAQNLADGHGLVFNFGEHVEGFSSFLWTVLLALGAAIGLHPQDLAPALGLIAGIGCLFLVARATELIGLPAVWRWLAPLAVAACTGFAFYSGSGMDTIVFALVLLGAVVACALAVGAPAPTRRLTITAAAALVLLVLVRAEGPLYSLALGATAGVLGSRRSRTALVPLLVAVAATIAVFAVRRAVYGTWVPATVSAKGQTTDFLKHHDFGMVWANVKFGAHYIGNGTLALLVLIAAALVVALRRRTPVPALVWLAAVALAVGTAVVLWSSGDWMYFHRLVVPLVPLLVLLAPWSARVLVPRVALGAAAAIVLAVLAVSAGSFDPDALTRPLTHLGPVAPGIGKALASTGQPVKLLTNVNGAAPYYAGSKTHAWDILGLTDPHNSRHGIFMPLFGRTDPTYTFTRDFDVLVTNSSGDNHALVAVWARTPSRYANYALLDSTRWQSAKLLVLVRNSSPALAPLERECGCRAQRATRRLVLQMAARSEHT